MTVYSLTLFIHFLGLVALFVGYGLEWAASSLLRRSATSDHARSWLRIYKLSLPISGPGLLVLILSGSYLASATGAMRQPWVSVSLLGIVFALGIGFVFILPRTRALGAGLGESGTLLSDPVRALLQDPVLMTLVRVRLLLALGIVYLMTVKTSTFAGGSLVLGVAMAVGLLCALASSRRTRA